MLLKIIVLPIFFTSTLCGILKEYPKDCSSNEFGCGDGTCIPFNRTCDGQKDCVNGRDESICHPAFSINDGMILHRSKRQKGCRKNQWQCRDGTCIGFDGKCDGVVDCPDGSDETHPLCRKQQCQSNWFRCTYGACVDGTALCNGIQECADNSDELNPKCSNTQDEIQGRFKCLNGQTISSASRCDGVADCTDGSDETIRACASNNCPRYLFQCAYGACVDQGSDCNGKQECADGSDESDELCNRIGTGTTVSPVKPSPGGACILPPYPEHGGYTVAGIPNASPGQGLDVVYMNITCNPGYGVVGNSSLFCFTGKWSGDIPRCSRFCKLNVHPSVDYRCLITGNNQQGTRDCNEYEPSGTVVSPECKRPTYYYAGVLSFMRCVEGSWDYVAICKPDCGKVTPDGDKLVLGGVSAKHGELPWHAGIYRKLETPYLQICGGSLVSTTVVISAAHCFWSETSRLLPASNYAVAIGKIYRPWNNPRDVDAQKSDVSDIKVPKLFDGVSANYQEDIALVIVSVPFEYKTYVRPVCLDFDYNFDRRQLKEGNMGKVAGWGLTAENGNASQVLKVVGLPYIDIERCITESPLTFREYITSDKFCAGYRNGTALCHGDSGGGLVFPEFDRGNKRYYLRGIVSTTPRNDNLCNAYSYTSFTQVIRHEHFIKEYTVLSL